jgi:hypothetical protein
LTRLYSPGVHRLFQQHQESQQEAWHTFPVPFSAGESVHRIGCDDRRGNQDTACFDSRSIAANIWTITDQFGPSRSGTLASADQRGVGHTGPIGSARAQSSGVDTENAAAFREGRSRTRSILARGYEPGVDGASLQQRAVVHRAAVGFAELRMSGGSRWPIRLMRR